MADTDHPRLICYYAAETFDDAFYVVVLRSYHNAVYDDTAPLLKVRKDAVGVVIAAAMNDPRLKGVFELDKTGAEKAARECTHVGLPHGEPVATEVIALKPQDIVTGEVLAAKFIVVPEIEFEAV